MTGTETRRPKDKTLARSGRLLGAISVAAGLVGVGIIAGLGHGDIVIEEGVIHMTLLAVGTGTLAWVTVDREARNGAVWTMVWAGFFAALMTVSIAVLVLWGHRSHPGFDLEVLHQLSPADVPLSVLLAASPWAWSWVPATMLIPTLGLLLFPDGRPPSPRWRWLAWYSLATIAVASVAFASTSSPSSTVPFGEDTPEAYNIAGQVGVAALTLAMFGALASVIALVVRYRRSSGVARRQIRWIAWGGAIFAAGIIWINVRVFFGSETGTADALVVLVAEALLILSFTVAITRYRLYDIDVVISKTVTYGALALFITAVYVAIVVGIGTLVGRGGEANLALAIVATATVALLFEPIRSRVQRWANRLVYGQRSTPYEVLARFSQRAATVEADDEMLGRIPRLIVDGTGASAATLWTASEGRLAPAAFWPELEASVEPIAVPADGPWRDPAADYSLPVEHDGELLGGISLVTGRGETITPAEAELVQNLAGGLGLVLRNARLTDDLRDQIDQLASSRERIVTAADEARRDLERDLDMGPQQELVAVKVKLGVVKSRAEAAQAAETAVVLEQLERDVGEAIESVRDFARGVYPPLLEAEGLAAAVSAEAEKAALPVSVATDGVGRYSREVETAVFFAILEALQNAAKYAAASSASVSLSDDGEHLRFEVSDDGRGFDPAADRDGSGLQSMSDRLDAAGGILEVESAPGRGTTVSGSVRVTQPAPVA